MQEAFMYTVHPRRPIRDLVKGEVIRKATSLMLTAEDVEKCCRDASVYRRFSPSKIVRVTIPDIERLHRKEFISEEDWKKMHETIGRGASHPIIFEVSEDEDPGKNGEEEQSRSDEEVKSSDPEEELDESSEDSEFVPTEEETPFQEESEVEFEEEEASEDDTEERPEESEPKEESAEDILDGLDVFSKGSRNEDPGKNGEEEQSRSDSRYQGSKKKRKRR